ncbi:hypothetical protein Tco_0829255 [Tanacetum coccineum]
MTPENKEHFQSAKEAIFLLLTVIRSEILLPTVDACNTIKKQANENVIITIKQPKPQRSNATSSNTRPSASTRHKGKEIAKPITPQSESVSVSDEDSDPEQAQRDKEMQKNLALLAKFQCSLGNQRTSDKLLGARENSRQSGMQEAKGVKGKRLHVSQGKDVDVQTSLERCSITSTEQADWLEDTDEEIDEQELEAHYSYMAKIQEVSPEESSSTGQPLEQDDSNVTHDSDSSNICTNDNQVDQNVVECVDERDALANLTLVGSLLTLHNIYITQIEQEKRKRVSCLERERGERN